MLGIKQKDYLPSWKKLSYVMVNNSRYWYEFERKESSQKMLTTLVIHYEDSTIVTTLPFQIHEINCKIL